MAMDADVRLLIGVARGGADGDSEALIRKELNEIMGKIKLEAKLDSKSFGEQIRKQLDAISKNGKFYVNLSKINIGAGAIADFRRQLNTVINTLNLDKGTSIMKGDGCGKPCLTVMSLLLTESPLQCTGLWSMTLVAEVKAM